MSDVDKLFKRLDDLLDRVEHLLPESTPKQSTDLEFQAYRWCHGGLEGIAKIDDIDNDELLHIEHQSDLISRNTALFVNNQSANNCLLWGARGTGKSSLIKSQFNQFKVDGLCVVEVPKSATIELFEIIRTLAADGRKFIVYLDDLSFESNDESYKALKECLEGSLQRQPDNILIYATSNRCQLMPESIQDNLENPMVEGQLESNVSIEETISLSDQFGLWLSFQPFTQDQYFAVIEQKLKNRELELTEEAKLEAIRFATTRGSRSGRIAVQFVSYWASIIE